MPPAKLARDNLCETNLDNDHRYISRPNLLASVTCVGIWPLLNSSKAPSRHFSSSSVDTLVLLTHPLCVLIC